MNTKRGRKSVYDQLNDIFGGNIEDSVPQIIHALEDATNMEEACKNIEKSTGISVCQASLKKVLRIIEKEFETTGTVIETILKDRRGSKKSVYDKLIEHHGGVVKDAIPKILESLGDAETMEQACQNLEKNTGISTCELSLKKALRIIKAKKFKMSGTPIMFNLHNARGVRKGSVRGSYKKREKVEVPEPVEEEITEKPVLEKPVIETDSADIEENPITEPEVQEIINQETVSEPVVS